ncbi:MAG TPA: MMPL family transporter [Ornithinibacter sp.]|nr:MMPL family transporter [Ornithinibacter sp.]
MDTTTTSRLERDRGTDDAATTTGSVGTPPPVDPSRHRSGLSLWSMRHRWLVLALSVLALAAGIALMATSGIQTTPPEDQLVGDSAVAAEIEERAGLYGTPTETVVATAKDGSLTDAEVTTIGTELATAYRDVEGIADIGEPRAGADGRSVVLTLTLDAEDDPAEGSTAPSPSEAVGPSLEATAAFAAANPELTVGQIGDGSVTKEVDATLGADFKRAELISIPLTLAILLVAFGAVVAAGVPLVLGLGSVGVALGLTAAASNGILPVDPNAQSLILLIGLAVGVDYALFVIRRAREERAAGADVRDSIALAGATAGRAVVISGITVIVAMSGMLVAGGLFTSLALGAMLVVLAAVIASATTLPALLAVLGDRVDALRLPFTARRRARAGSPDSLWGRLAGAVSRRPVRWGAAAVAVLLALSVPALGMKTALGGIETLSPDLAVVQAYRQLETAVPSDGTAVTIAVDAPGDLQADVLAALDGVREEAGTLPHVSGVAPEAVVSDDGTATVLPVGIAMDASDDRLPGVVADIRETLVPQVEAALVEVPGAEVHVGGQAAATDLSAWMDDRLPWVVAFVLVLTLLVMTISFGSPWLAVATVALNVLSVGAAYGLMTLVFQGTWAEGVLAFSSTGAIAAWLPMLMFVILFGLSMDYHVFVTSRVREAYAAGHDPSAAVRLGVARSAGVVTSAAAVMVGVFSIFGTLSSLEMKQLGVGLATAVLLDATLVRGVLLPATLTVLGERAHHGPRWIPRIHH